MEDIFVQIGVLFLDDQHYQERSIYPSIYKCMITHKADGDIELVCKFHRNKPYDTHYAITGEFNLKLYTYVQMNVREHEYIFRLTSDIFIPCSTIIECINSDNNIIHMPGSMDTFTFSSGVIYTVIFERTPCGLVITDIKILLGEAECNEWLEQYKKYKKHLSS